MDNFLLQLLNGLVTSMLLFIMAAGLSLIFGQMRVINLSHGAFYLVGGYMGLTAVKQWGAFWPALLLTPLLVGAMGWLAEQFLLRGRYGRERQLQQVLLTFGVALVLSDLAEWRWGAYTQTVPPPVFLATAVPLFGLQFPLYRLAIIAMGLLLALALALFLGRTRLGAILRAGVTHPHTVSGLGIDVERVFAATFAGGVALAALAGILGSPITTLYPGLDFEILILTIVVVVIGGLGSLRGAFVGALLIGLTDTFGKARLPEFSLFLIFAVMAVVLLVRPSGLFGVEEGH
ncbi:MAG: branched-chain amino acid ABC transporter permease [Chloroflexota bacterium]|nr:MAG: branched-chain amino acid ABC transporter permease [Chloroflexota bacterium]